jgi:hypothetical protein
MENVNSGKQANAYMTNYSEKSDGYEKGIDGEEDEEEEDTDDEDEEDIALKYEALEDFEADNNEEKEYSIMDENGHSFDGPKLDRDIENDDERDEIDDNEEEENEDDEDFQEWENDDDPGYIIIPISDEQFMQLQVYTV